MYDLDIGFGSNAMLGAPYNYDREFAWKGVPSGIQVVHKLCDAVYLSRDLFLVFVQISSARDSE